MPGEAGHNSTHVPQGSTIFILDGVANLQDLADHLLQYGRQVMVTPVEQSGAELLRTIATLQGQLAEHERTEAALVAERKRIEQHQAMRFAVTQIISESRSRQAAVPRLLQTICTHME